MATGPGALDRTDRALLAALRHNGRASWAELGRLLGLSAPSVQERVRRLEEREVITGYSALVEPAATGLGVTALVGVALGESAEQQDVALRLRDLLEIEDCYLVAGEDSFLAKLRVPDIAALERSLSRLQGIRGVARTRTTVVLSTPWEHRTPPAPEPA